MLFCRESTYVFNCYILPPRLLLFGRYEITSVEGTTQGDPITMEIFAIAVIPLLLIALEIVTTFLNNNVKMTAYAI